MEAENIAPRDHHAPSRQSAAASTGSPLVAVIIPTYKQPQYLPEAVISAIRQSFRHRTRIVIVNDGCPYSSTDWLGRYFRDAFPGEVSYLRKRNDGLASARNFGISFAFNTWPSIQAILPLDSDDKLSPNAIEWLWEKLSTSQPNVGWVYQDIAYFGTTNRLLLKDLPFSVYRMLHDNLCEASNLIHRRVFEAGVWYDEAMRDGFEDWEFYISASLQGFRAAHLPETGLLYRRHGNSMITGTLNKREAILRYIRAKHSRKLRHNDLTLLEHTELPRFALVAPDGGGVVYFTSRGVDEAPPVPVSSYVDALVAWAGDPVPNAPYVPPIALFARRDVLDFLLHLRLLPGLLLKLQRRLASADYVSVSVGRSENPYCIDIGETSEAGDPVLVGVGSRSLVQLARKYGASLGQRLRKDARWAEAGVRLNIGSAFLLDAPGLLTEEPSNVLDAALDVWEQLAGNLSADAQRGPRRARQYFADGQELFPSHADFAVKKHLERGYPSFPPSLPYCVPPEQLRERPVNVFFTLTRFGLRGIEQCVRNLAEALSRLRPGYSLHLVLTESTRIEARPEWLHAFDTITGVPVQAPGGPDELLELLQAADVVVDVHSSLIPHAGLAPYYRPAPADDLLAGIRRKSRAHFVSYLHRVDFDHDGVPHGYPVVAVRQYEALIDRFIVPSEQLRRLCLKLGAPAEKLLLLPNAPGIAPASTEAALGLAREKGTRRYTPERPLKVLFVGQLEHRKGLYRLERLAEDLPELGLPVELRLVGAAAVPRPEFWERLPNARVSGGMLGPEELAGAYAEADVFLLPSRAEGLPLALLEAMAFGNLVMVTNVGAIGEVVEDGKSGFVLDAMQSEENLAIEIRRIIADIVADPRRYDQLRLQACTTAMEASWTESATRLARMIDAIID